MQTTETETFCGICRHPAPGHDKNCPVYTGHTIQGNPGIPQGLFQDQNQLQQNSMMGGGTGDSFSIQCPYCGGLNGIHTWAGSGSCPGARLPQGQTYLDMVRQGKIPLEDGYEVAKIYKEARERLLEELKSQVEVNRLLCKDLLDARLKLAEFKLKYKIVE